MSRHRQDKLTRDPDGSARLRIRLRPEVADLLEQEAKEEGLPVLEWLFEKLETKL